MINKELAKRFRKLREDKGLTRKQLVECMNYVVINLNPKTELKQRISKHNKEDKEDFRSEKTIQYYEDAERRITEEVAEVMALVCSIDTKVLLNCLREKEKKPIKENRCDINPKYLLDENAPKKWTKDSLRKDIEELQIKLTECAFEFSLMIDAIKALATLNGYEVELNTNSYNSLSEYFSNRKNYLVLKKDDKIIHTLSDSDIIIIGNILIKFLPKKLSDLEKMSNREKMEIVSGLSGREYNPNSIKDLVEELTDGQEDYNYRVVTEQKQFNNKVLTSIKAVKNKP